MFKSQSLMLLPWTRLIAELSIILVSFQPKTHRKDWGDTLLVFPFSSVKFFFRPHNILRFTRAQKLLRTSRWQSRDENKHLIVRFIFILNIHTWWKKWSNTMTGSHSVRIERHALLDTQSDPNFHFSHFLYSCSCEKNKTVSWHWVEKRSFRVGQREKFHAEFDVCLIKA